MPSPYPSETGCCPRFQPEPWQEREFRWEARRFIKDRVRCLFHVPLGFGRVITGLLSQVERAGAFTPEPPVTLSDHTSAWNMELYVEVSEEVKGAQNVVLSGNFMSKVFEGPFRDTGKWCKEMAEWVRSRGRNIKHQWMYYTTCPKCARHYGRNYVVILAEV